MINEIPDIEQAEAYMKSAIRAANGLRVELNRAFPGPLTVSPSVGLLGGIVAVYVSSKQAEQLADIVRRAGCPTAPAAEQWLIWSHEHNAWWKPNSLGYTTNVAFAGRYSEEAARRICEGAAYGWRKGAPPPEVMVRADSPDLADAVAIASQRAIELKLKTEGADDGTDH